jgi:hypothetical protein
LNDLCNLEPQLPLSEKESTVIRTTLAAFPDALRLVDSAAGKTGVDWQIHRRTPVIFKHLPDLTPQNHLALLLAADLLSAHEAGDDSRAVRRAQQILFIGRALDRQSTRPSQAYATSIAALAAKRLILIAPTMCVGNAGTESSTTSPADPLLVTALINTLLAQDADNAGLSQAMRGWRMELLDDFTAIASGRLDLEHYLDRHSDVLDNGGSAEAKFVGYLFKPILLIDARTMARYMDGVVAAISASNWPAGRSSFPAFPAQIRSHWLIHIHAVMLMSSGVDLALKQQFRFRTDLTLAATSLAIRQYAADNEGKLPENLAELTPRYLAAVPLDPMTAGKPLGYIRGDQPGLPHAGDPIIYSVGENGIDEGGSEQPLWKSSAVWDRWGTQDAVVHLTQQPRKPEEFADDGRTPATAPSTRPGK